MVPTRQTDAFTARIAVAGLQDGAEVDVATVLVLVDDHLESSGLTAIDWSDLEGDILPVSLLGHESKLFRDRVQVIVKPGHEEDAIARIARTLEVGGTNWVAWNRLAARATAWNDDSGGALLAARELPGALALRQQPFAHTQPSAEVVRRYVRTSATAAEHRRRSWTLVFSVATIVLVTAIVIAVRQSVVATASAFTARAAAAAADADRIAKSATGLIGRDPDLPTVLLGKAAQRSDTPAVQSATIAAEATTIEHRSIGLPAVPRSVDAAQQAQRVAVTYFDDPRVDVFDQRGALVGGAPNLADSVVALDPAGRRIAAMTANGVLTLADVRTGRTFRRVAVPQGEAALAWTQDGLMVGVGADIDRVSASTGAISTLFRGDAGEVVRRVRASPDGRLLVIMFAARVVVLDGSAGRVLHTLALSSITDAAIDNGGSSLALATFPYCKTVELASVVDVDTSRVRTSIVPCVSAVSVGQGYSVLGARDGSVAALADGDPTPLMLWQAHLSDNVRLAAMSGGTVASAGLDRYLRLWTMNPATQLGTATQISAPSSPGDAITGGIAPGVRHHSQIARTSNGVLITRLPASATWTGADTGEIGGPLGSQAVIAPSGHHIAFVGIDRIEVDRWDARTGKVGGQILLQTGTFLSVNASRAGDAAVGISPDGTKVVLANDSQAQLIDSQQMPVSTVSWPTASEPLAVQVSDDGEVHVLTADGYMRTTHGTTTGQTELHSGRLATATFAANGIWAVTSTGRVLRIRDGRTITVARVATAVDPFSVVTSADGRLVAVVGTAATEVFDSVDGSPWLSHPARGDAVLTDLLLPDGGRGTVLAVTATGTLVRLEIYAHEPAAFPVPREPTAAEAAAYALVGGADG